jgi:hypothetical protein
MDERVRWSRVTAAIDWLPFPIWIRRLPSPRSWTANAAAASASNPMLHS